MRQLDVGAVSDSSAVEVDRGVASDELRAARDLLERIGAVRPERTAQTRLEEAVRLVERRSTEAIYDQLRSDARTPQARLVLTRAPSREHCELSVSIFGELGALHDVEANYEHAELAQCWAVIRARELGVGLPLVRALSTAVVASAEAGNGLAVDAYLAELAGATQEIAVERPEIGAEALLSSAQALLEIGRLSEAKAAARRAIEISGAAAPTSTATHLQAKLVVGWIAIHRGRVAEAASTGEWVYREVRQRRLAGRVIDAESLHGVARARSGHGVLWGNRLASAAERAASNSDLRLRRRAYLGQAIAALALRRYETALEAAERAGARQPPAGSIKRLLPALIAAECCVAITRRDWAGHRTAMLIRARLGEGRQLIDSVLGLVDSMPWLVPRAKRVSALIDAERGLLQAMDASESLRVAMNEAEQQSGAVEAAECLAALGELGERLEKSDPRPLYAEAVELARSAGAATRAETIEGLIDDLSLTRAVSMMLELGHMLTSMLSLETLAERVVEAMLELLKADRGLLVLYQKPRRLDQYTLSSTEHRVGVQVARSISGRPCEELKSDPVALRIVRAVQKGCEAVLSKHRSHDERPLGSRHVAPERPRVVLGLPINTEEHTFGVLYLESRSPVRVFTNQQVAFVEPFTSRIAEVFEKAFAYTRIQDLLSRTLSLERARKRIVNHISHELKTPLAIVSSVLNLLRKRLPRDDAAIQRLLQRGERNLERLVDIQSAMVDIYRAKAAPPRGTFDEVELSELLRNIVSEARDASPHRTLDIKVDAQLLTVRGNFYALEAAVSGLVRNAIENTPDGGRIVVAGHKGRDETAVIRVRDYGVGIDAYDQKHLFEGFFHTQQTDLYSTKRPFDFDAGGKGTDLWRIQTFAERYGWEVRVKSRRCAALQTLDAQCAGDVSSCAQFNSDDSRSQCGFTEFTLTLPLIAPLESDETLV